MGLLPAEYAKIVQGSLTPDNALFYWLRRMAEGRNPLTGNLEGVGLPQLAAKLDDVLNRQAAEVARDANQDKVLTAMAAAINAGGGNVDTAALLSHMEENHQAVLGRLDSMKTELEAERAENARLRTILAAAGESLSSADDAPTG